MKTNKSFKATAVVQSCKPITKDGRRIVVWNFEILDGPFEGEIVTKWSNLTSKKAVNQLKKEFAKLGITLEKKGDLEKVCKKVEGKKVIIEVHTDENGYHSVYIIGLLDEASQDNDEDIDDEDFWK